MPNSYGLLVEGDHDEPSFETFVRRIQHEQVTVHTLSYGGKPHLLSRAPDLLRRLEFILDGRPVDRVLVVRDLDSQLPDRVVEKFNNQVLTRRNYRFPEGVQLFLVRQELEAILLADIDAVNSISRSRGGRRISPVNENLEQIQRPKELLVQKLTEAGAGYYTPALARQIAEEASLDMIRYRCPSFESFVRMVLE